MADFSYILKTMIPVAFRFHGHNSLRYVYANGKSVRSQYVTIKTVSNPRRSKPRLSVVVSKKVLKSAVGRNRIRRRVYEYMRPHLLALPTVYDIVIIVTSSELRDMPAGDLSTHLDGLLEKAHLTSKQ